MNRYKRLGVLLSLSLSINVLLAVSNMKFSQDLGEESAKNTRLSKKLEKSTLSNKEKSEKIIKLENKNNDLENSSNLMRGELAKYSSKVYYDSDNLESPSMATSYHMRKALKGTNLEDLAPYFVEAESSYGINAYFLAALVAQESSWGSSKRAVEDNNLSGFEVYTSDSRGAIFCSKRKSILKTAEILRINYLNKDGKNYHGKSAEAINTDYCLHNDTRTTDYSWSANINQIANSLVVKSNN